MAAAAPGGAAAAAGTGTGTALVEAGSAWDLVRIAGAFDDAANGESLGQRQNRHIAHAEALFTQMRDELGPR